MFLELPKWAFMLQIIEISSWDIIFSSRSIVGNLYICKKHVTILTQVPKAIVKQVFLPLLTHEGSHFFFPRNKNSTET